MRNDKGSGILSFSHFWWWGKDTEDTMNSESYKGIHNKKEVWLSAMEEFWESTGKQKASWRATVFSVSGFIIDLLLIS